MFRNCLAAALRHLARNRLYTLISVVGLAIGLCVALMAALVIRNQYSYDHNVPGYERTYMTLVAINPPGLAKQYIPVTLLDLAAQLKLQVPSVEGASRIFEDDNVLVERGNLKWHEVIYWADANLPEVLPLPLYAGNASEALGRPDGLVLSRNDARKFFGSDSPLGQTLTIDGHPMVVRAVIQNSPLHSTHMQRDLIAAGISSFSPEKRNAGSSVQKIGPFSFSGGTTYVRLKPGVNIVALDGFLSRVMHLSGHFPNMLSLELVRIDRFNSYESLHPGFHARIVMLGVLGILVLLIAIINFVNLQTACAGLRAREVAIRGLSGASRRTLIAQFLGESLIYASTATLLAAALAEWLLPRLNAFLVAGAELDYGREPWLVGVLACATLLVGSLAGIWPALVISGFRPGTVLRDGGALPGRYAVRRSLVTVQFTLLIGLAISAGVVYRQREFALTDALRMNRDQVLIIYAPGGGAFADQVRGLPGVRAVTGATLPFLGSSLPGPFPSGVSVAEGKTRSGKDISIHTVGVDFNLFDFYGIRPLAGHLPIVGAAHITAPEFVVLNKTAARKYEFASPLQAIGKTVPIGTPDRRAAADGVVESTILAVVPDFSLESVAEAVPPTVYFQYTDNNRLDVLNVRLAGRDIPETLAAIDALWKHTGHSDPLSRVFLDEQISGMYQSVLRQSEAFGICALIALGLCCIGLLALTAATAQRRTREIGIRKALGADMRDVLWLLLWHFSKPVMWANLVAWPIAGYVMSRWLNGFAYHIALPLWLFPAAAGAALLIALLTVSTHAVLVARSKPVVALRYE